MSEQDDKPDERLEGMLRRWGADQAAREALVPPAPVAVRPRRSTLSGVLYWVSTAAAAGILVGVGLVYFGPKYFQAGAPSEREPLGKSPQAPQTRPSEAQAALAAAISARAEAERKLADADTRAEKAESQLTYLRRIQEAQKQELDQLRGKLTEAVTAGQKGELEVKLVSAQLQEAARKLADAEAQVQKLQGAPERLAAALAELNRVRQMHDEAIAASQKEAAQLAALRAEHANLLAEFQKAYLGLAAEGHEGLAARQAAAKRTKMVERLAALRPLVSKEPTRQLLDKLEVALVRLGMLNPNDPAAGESFARLVSTGGLVGQIDEALAGSEAPAVRVWLLEARLILQGVDRVG